MAVGQHAVRAGKSIHVPTWRVHSRAEMEQQALSQPSDNGGSFSSDFGPFSGFEN